MDTTYRSNGDGTYTATTTNAQPFDPVAIQAQITDLQAQMAAAVELATSNAQAQFQPQIDALSAELAAFNAQINPTP